MDNLDSVKENFGFIREYDLYFIQNKACTVHKILYFSQQLGLDKLPSIS